jgi:transposase
VVNPPASPQPERKAEIVRRLEAGESVAVIAAATGVTPQYVAAIKDQWEREGTATGLASRRYGPRPRRLLTPEEEAGLHAHITAGRPSDEGGTEPWTAPEVIDWFGATFG